MYKTEILVVGGGPAGLAAALAAAEQGAEVTLADRNSDLGGQLVKQTHMFFGSKGQYASERGISIAKILKEKAAATGKIRILTGATVTGYYEDKKVTIEAGDKFFPVEPQRVIFATGAQENTLIFPGCDLPGIYGAGAVQTLMNLHGVKPGNRVAMVGAGNIGVIVSYQLLQAGVEVAAIIEAAPRIGGYYVHAAKVRRLGVPILTSHTVIKAHGNHCLEKITIAELDEKRQVMAGSERDLEVDVLCVSVGLSPLAELLFQAGCRMGYVPELGGFVPFRDDCLETSVAGIYVAGDAAGIGEASAAMVQGRIAGLAAAASLGYGKDTFLEKVTEAGRELTGLHGGPTGEKIRTGLAKLTLLAKEAV